MVKEIIKIITKDDGDKLISARELHEFLEVKSKYNDWISNRIKKYGFIENEDYILVTKILVTNNPKNPTTEAQDHAVTIDMAKELSMVENNEKGKEARRYFINCEKQIIKINMQKLLKESEDQLNEYKQLLDESKRQFKPSHKRKLQYNKLIKQLSSNDDECEAIKVFALATLACDTWEQTSIEDAPRIMELISTAAALISSKQFSQTKLF